MSENAAEYFKSLGGRGSRPGLERIKELLEILNNPQDRFGIIHVAGTNGKGSVCRMLEGILLASGFNVGLFTSPYIVSPPECIRAGGQSVPEDEFYSLCGRIRDAERAMSEGPTEFEALTAMAFLYFAKRDCDIVIIEAGMGGRLDATNVVRRPLLSVITDVELDHTEYLGPTIKEIAREKAGIIKRSCPVVFGGRKPEALEVVQNECALRQAPLALVDFEKMRVRSFGLRGTRFDFGELSDVFTPLLGTYQPRNAAVALTAVEALRGQSIEISDEAVRDGMKNLTHPGRFELLGENPAVIYDGAHNPMGMEKAAESVKAYFGGRVILLMGVMRDKDYERMTEIIAPLAEKAFTIKPDNPRSLDAEALTERFKTLGVPSEPCLSVKDGYSKAFGAAKAANIPLIILGSLYFYKDIV